MQGKIGYQMNCAGYIRRSNICDKAVAYRGNNEGKIILHHEITLAYKALRLKFPLLRLLALSNKYGRSTGNGVA
jgi:hypothetical protein